MKQLEFKKILPKYKVLMDNIQEMVIIFDKYGKIVDCNTQALCELGYKDDIFLLPVKDVFRKAFLYRDHKIELDTKYKEGPSETIAYRKNNTCFPVSLKVVMFKTKGFSLGLCTAVNITEQKEALQEAKYLKHELITIDQMNNELIANVTHELRTPINGIMGFSNSLIDSGLTPNQIEDVKIILRCCTNMSTIVNNILDYTKLTNCKLELEQIEFNFRDFIARIIEVNSVLINEKGLKLLVNISKEIPENVVGDELRLSQVLNNLFSNAIKFTSVGHIGLEITKTYEIDQSIELFFMLFDTGIGISPEEKDKLFKSFSQVDGSITRIYGGSGLGLSICKRLVEAMGGAIRVDSEKNKGSAFSFSIRLKLPKDISPDTKERNINVNKAKLTTELDHTSGKGLSEIDYINMRLKEACKSHQYQPDSSENMLNIMKALQSIIEKVIICIEMDNWNTAEELSVNMRKMVPQSQIDLSKKILSILLNLRKENKEVSLLLLNELKDAIKKEV